jgi:hypothetical protein
MMRDIPMHWCACSSRPSSWQTHYPPTAATTFSGRLDRVRVIGHEFGYGVGDDMDFLLSKFRLKSL